jgi:hypothetical protein
MEINKLKYLSTIFIALFLHICVAQAKESVYCPALLKKSDGKTQLLQDGKPIALSWYDDLENIAEKDRAEKDRVAREGGYVKMPLAAGGVDLSLGFKGYGLLEEDISRTTDQLFQLVHMDLNFVNRKGNKIRVLVGIPCDHLQTTFFAPDITIVLPERHIYLTALCSRSGIAGLTPTQIKEKKDIIEQIEKIDLEKKIDDSFDTYSPAGQVGGNIYCGTANPPHIWHYSF